MRQANVFRNNILAGILVEENNQSYLFRYDDEYFLNTQLPPISLTLPKSQQEHRCPYLFPFFYNLLSEGVNKRLQSRQLQIDKNDSFGLLIATAKYDTIGAISVKKMDDE